MRLKLGRRKMLALGATVVLIVVAWVAWWMGGSDGLILVVLATSVASTLALGWLIVQSDRRSRRTIAALQGKIEKVEREQLGNRRAVDRRLDDLTQRVAGPGRHTEQVLAAINSRLTRTESGLSQSLARGFSETSARVVEAVRASDRELGEKLIKASERESKHVSTESKRLFRQLEALAALYTDVRPDVSLPPSRGWAASPDLLVYLYGVVRQRRPKLIVECGSGLSTLVMAHALKANQFGKIVALEHSERFRETTREWLIAHDVDGWVDLRHAPLTSAIVDGREWLWYSMDALPEAEIDLLFVDGPPGDTMANARYPAMPLLVDRLSAGALVVLDDAGRSEEAEIAERWSELYPQWTMEKLIHEKGTITFTMNGLETAPSSTTEATLPQ